MERLSLTLVLLFLLFTSGSSIVMASDYDYGADTLPYLIARSECIVWTSAQEPKEVTENERLRVVTFAIERFIAGNCARDHIRVEFPAGLDPNLAKDALLFVGSFLSREEAELRGCAEHCRELRTLVSDYFGVVPHTPQRYDAIFDYFSRGMDNDAMGWAFGILKSPTPDAFLQNSAIYLVFAMDPKVERGESRQFYYTLFFETEASADVKQFGISTISNDFSPTGSQLLLEVAQSDDIPSRVRINAYDELWMTPLRMQEMSMGPEELDGLSEEIRLLRSKPTFWAEFSGLRYEPADDERFAAARAEDFRDGFDPVQTEQLRRIIADPSIDSISRSTAVESYLERVQGSPDEVPEELPITYGSYELELQIREANAVLNKLMQESQANEQ